MPNPEHVKIVSQGKEAIDIWRKIHEAEELDCSGANLIGANLYGADLSGANLSGAKYVVVLPVSDPRGYYPALGVWDGKSWVVTIGCRRFSIDVARDHWGGNYHGDPDIGAWYCWAISLLPDRPPKDGIVKLRIS